tara:strand:- start:64295 stop:64909 length:615 start_codon:yes stop_codon:yes gene_type:complete
MSRLSSEYLLLKSSLFLGILIFFIYLLFDLGVLKLIIDSDRSKISIIILFIYFLASFHWFFLCFVLDKDISNFSKNNSIDSSLYNIDQIKESKNREKLLSLLEDDLSNKNALGYLIIDLLLKLGLTGTVIGFILMLLPIGDIKDFDPKVLQQLLAQMSGGMAVALYTTLTGLVTSLLLKFQYYLLDSSLSRLINAIYSDVLDEA